MFDLIVIFTISISRKNAHQGLDVTYLAESIVL
jgi:hypothetical protein